MKSVNRKLIWVDDQCDNPNSEESEISGLVGLSLIYTSKTFSNNHLSSRMEIVLSPLKSSSSKMLSVSSWLGMFPPNPVTRSLRTIKNYSLERVLSPLRSYLLKIVLILISMFLSIGVSCIGCFLNYFNYYG